MGITTGVVDNFTRELLFEDELAVKTAHDILVVLHGVLKHTAAQLPGIFPAVEINEPWRSDLKSNRCPKCWDTPI